MVYFVTLLIIFLLWWPSIIALTQVNRVLGLYSVQEMKYRGTEASVKQVQAQKWALSSPLNFLPTPLFAWTLGVWDSLQNKLRCAKCLDSKGAIDK